MKPGATSLQRRRPDHGELRRKAARQAQHNLYGKLEAGGLSRHGRATIAAIEGRP